MLECLLSLLRKKDLQAIEQFLVALRGAKPKFRRPELPINPDQKAWHLRVSARLRDIEAVQEEHQSAVG